MLNGTDQTAKPYDIYARVSRIARKNNKKKNEPSTGGQVAICRLRLADLDLPEGKVLTDPGRSAWDPTVKRPAWDELMDRLERGVSGGFIVFDLERFTRQPKDGERMIELAVRDLGVLDRVTADGHLPCVGTVSAWGSDEPKTSSFFGPPARWKPTMLPLRWRSTLLQTPIENTGALIFASFSAAARSRHHAS